MIGDIIAVCRELVKSALIKLFILCKIPSVSLDHSSKQRFYGRFLLILPVHGSRRNGWRLLQAPPWDPPRGTCKVRTNKVVYFVQNPICFTGSFVKTEILWAFFAYFARTRKPQKRMAAFASSAVGSTTGNVRPTASAAKGSSVQPSRNTPAPRVIICSTTVKRSAR